MTRELSPVADFVERHARNYLIPAVDRFRSLQADDGHVVGDVVEAAGLLNVVCDEFVAVSRVTGDDVVPVLKDISTWRAALTEPPAFVFAAGSGRVGGNGRAIQQFLAVTATTNGPQPGHRLEYLLYLVEEPESCRKYLAKKGVDSIQCQFVRQIAGSCGYRVGNAIVSFSEQIKGAPKGVQTFALFLMNKFYPIFHRITLPAAKAVFGAEGWRCDRLTPAETYDARCNWAAGHEIFHQTGPRPLARNLKVKLNFFAGLLEELKVDALVLLDAVDGTLPFGDVADEFVLFERMIRYPKHPAATCNFDAGTGVFLFEFLADRGVIRRQAGQGLRLDRIGLTDVLRELIDLILTIERIGDDGAYKAAAEALVRTYLPTGEPGERFRFPARYLEFARPTPEVAPLSFHELPY